MSFIHYLLIPCYDRWGFASFKLLHLSLPLKYITFINSFIVNIPHISSFLSLFCQPEVKSKFHSSTLLPYPLLNLYHLCFCIIIQTGCVYAVMNNYHVPSNLRCYVLQNGSFYLPLGKKKDIANSHCTVSSIKRYIPTSEMLKNVWCNPQTFLMGVQNGFATALDTVWQVFKMVNVESTYNPAVWLLSIYSRKMKACIYTKTRT